MQYDLNNMSDVIHIGLKVIPSSYMRCNKKLIHLDLDQGVEEISHDAFSLCINLKSVTFPDTLAVLGDRAFHKCTSIKEISLPQKISKIPIECFHRCYSLEKVILPENLNEICSLAFNSCFNLKELTIPASVNILRPSAFSNCSSLKTVYLQKKLISKVKNDFDKIFINCQNLKDVIEI